MFTPEISEEVILSHYRQPRHRGALDDCSCQGDISNPLCGDQLHFEIAWSAGGALSLGFTGQGCAVSQAAASILCEQLTGKDRVQVEGVLSHFQQFLRSEGDDSEREPYLGHLAAFAIVRDNPARVECALLGARLVEQLLDQSMTSSTGQ